MSRHRFRSLCLASGIGGNALGAKQSLARLGEATASFRIIGGWTSRPAPTARSPT
jgi:hypothetical protein